MKTIIANWKNNLSFQEAEKLLENTLSKVSPEDLNKCQLIIAGSYLSLPVLKKCLKQHHPKSSVLLSAQDISAQTYGAYTGQVCADDIYSIASHTIIGHSEARMYLNQNDQDLSQKISQALRANLKVILCVGESYQQKMDKLSYVVVADQILSDLSYVSLEELRFISIAYEPIWSISTSEHALPAHVNDINKMNIHIRQVLNTNFGDYGQNIPILYGGSVSLNNIREYLNIIDCSGYLVGGASLKVDELIGLINIIVEEIN